MNDINAHNDTQPSLNTVKPSRINFWFISTILLVVLGISAGVYFYLPVIYADKCIYGFEAYEQTMDPLLQEFRDSINLASSISRISLPPVVQDLQGIYRSAQNVNPPDCMEEAHRDMLLGMREALDGFLAFMSDKDDKTISAHFEDSGTYIQGFTLTYSVMKLSYGKTD